MAGRLSPEGISTLALHVLSREADVGEQVVVELGKVEALTPTVLEPEDESQCDGSQTAKGAGAKNRTACSARGDVLHALLLPDEGIAVAVQK